MLAEQSAELVDCCGHFTRAMRAGDDLFGLRGGKMGAPILHHPVGAVRRVSLAAVADDGEMTGSGSHFPL